MGTLLISPPLTCWRDFHVGFLFKGSTFAPIIFPGAQDTLADRINNSGQVLGEYVDAAGAAHGYMTSRHGNSLPRVNAPESHPVGVRVGEHYIPEVLCRLTRNLQLSRRRGRKQGSCGRSARYQRPTAICVQRSLLCPGRVASAGWVAAYDSDFSRPWSPQRLPTREHRILGGKQENKHICGMSLLCRKYPREPAEPFQASILHFYTTFPVSNMRWPSIGTHARVI